MTDGAHLGITAGAALRAIFGSDEPLDEPMTAGEMRAWIEAASLPLPDDRDEGYTEASRYAAKLILHWLLADPSRASTPVEADYDWDADPDRGTQGMKPEHTRAVGWYQQMKDDGIPINELDLTGFMWGWAANAARRCVELPPAPNPAIVEFKR